MLVVVDVSDLHLAQNHLFRTFEPYLLDCTINYCASYCQMPYDKFHTEMVEYLFDGTLFDEDYVESDKLVNDRLNDLEEKEFNMLVIICFEIYQRVSRYYLHIWNEPSLEDTVLVAYRGQLNNYGLLQVEIELDAPDHMLMAYNNRKAMKRNRPKKDLTYIPKGI